VGVKHNTGMPIVIAMEMGSIKYFLGIVSTWQTQCPMSFGDWDDNGKPVAQVNEDARGKSLSMVEKLVC
jgi:hypothetical protein